MNSLTAEEEQFCQKLTEKVTSRTYRLDSEKRASLYDAFEQKHRCVQLIQRWMFGSIGFAIVAVAFTFLIISRTHTPPATTIVGELMNTTSSRADFALASTALIDLRIKEARHRLSRVEVSETSTFFNSNPKRNQTLKTRINALREDLS